LKKAPFSPALRKTRGEAFLKPLLTFLLILSLFAIFAQTGAYAAETAEPPAAKAPDMFAKANEIIKDVYRQLVGLSTLLAGLMSAVAVIGAKLSNNQHKTEQAWDWRATRS
jgi:hypothetical protein